ncbi:MAG: hypothetical protein JKY54_09590, partial [Flavobacteriales bacterium]|nr:hypothetical protein [Flavobacteriales bacterium]
MNNLLQRYKIVLPMALIALLATSCNSHGSKVFFFSFLFYVIFIILCLPAIILSGVARGNGSKSAKTTGLVFTCIGGFFAFIYTFNLIDDPHLKFIEEEI